MNCQSIQLKFVSRLSNFFKKHVEKIRNGLLLLFIITSVLAVLLAYGMNIPGAVIGQILSTIELSIATGSHIYLSREPKPWMRIESGLVKARSLLLRIGAGTTPSSEMIAEKDTLASQLMLLPSYSDLSVRVYSFARQLSDWRPYGCDDPRIEELLDDVTSFLDEIREDTPMQRVKSVSQVFEYWSQAILDVRDADPRTLVDVITGADRLPNEVINTISESNVLNPSTLFRAATYVKLSPPSIAVMTQILEKENLPTGVLNKCINETLKWLDDSHMDIALAIVRVLERKKDDKTTRKNILDRLCDKISDDSAFVELGREGLEAALSLPASKKKRILLARLDRQDSDDRILESIVESLLEVGNTEAMEKIAARIEDWHSQTVENALIHLRKSKYRNLKELLYRIASRDSGREYWLRSFAIEMISEMGDSNDLGKLQEMNEHETDHRVKAALTNAYEKLIKGLRPRSVRRTLD